MRRGVGVGAIQKKKETESKYKEKGSELAGEQLTQLSQQLEAFRSKLETFAAQHRNEIRKDPAFRQQFQEMCATIGVDPLASGKGFWSEKLGVGDFYYELAVQIVEICLATSHQNGGLMKLNELHQRLLKSRSKIRKENISKDDLLRAIGKLKILGNGFTVVPLLESRGEFLIQSVPGELNMDHTRAIQAGEDSGRISVPKLVAQLNWDEERAKRVCEHLVKEGFVWVDEQSDDGFMQYWFPGLFTKGNDG